MNVELKADDGNTTIQSLNPFGFQSAVKSISCTPASGSNPSQLNIDLNPEFADQARRWNISPTQAFAVLIPHDFVDLKNKACYDDLDPTSKEWTQTHPMETVVKQVMDPKFLDNANNSTLTLTVVKTDIWSQMNRAQAVRIYHKPIDEITPKIFGKRSDGDQRGPMWDFEHDLSEASKNIANNDNVNVDVGASTVKGYAQADMGWKQDCTKDSCTTSSVASAKISGMTQVNHNCQVGVKSPAGGSDNTSPVVDIDVTTPGFPISPSISLVGFSVPGVFDIGASVNIGAQVSLKVLVSASQDLLLNTGNDASCPWVVDWNGKLTDIPTIQFGTCTFPDTAKVELAPMDNASRQTSKVDVGVTVSPSIGLGLSLVGVVTALSASITAPITVGIHTNWDTQATDVCSADNVALSADMSASLQLNGAFFGFSKSIPVATSPVLTSPSTCIPH
ncbi:hypothetical protein BGZ98_008672 [Dissophora globulifera]|nr:hypothetical protein BGZ98_008672 [Dissophora globulifera]